MGGERPGEAGSAQRMPPSVLLVAALARPPSGCPVATAGSLAVRKAGVLAIQLQNICKDSVREAISAVMGFRCPDGAPTCKDARV